MSASRRLCSWLLWPGSILLIGAVAAGLYWLIFQPVDSGGYSVHRQVHWHLVVRNQSAEALRDVEVLSFIPHSLTWQQSLAQVSANYPVTIDTDDKSQPSGRILLDVIPPYGQRELLLQAELKMANHHTNREEAALTTMLEPEPLIESDNEEIIALAQRLQRAEAAETAVAIYDWLVAEVDYDGYDPVDRGALYALEQRKGDCSEYAALAVALARALGLPARLVNGYRVPDSGRLEPFAFHAWAEIYLDGRWLILDAQERRFDPSPENYLVTHYGTSEARQTDWIRFHSPESRISIEMR